MGQKTSDFYQIFLLIAVFKNCIVEFTPLFVYFLLSWSRIYKVATSMVRNSSISWLLYPHFSNTVNLCPNFDSFKIQNVSNFYFEEEPPKTHVFNSFTRPLFRNGWLHWYERWRVLRDFCRLFKNCSSVTFPKI